MMGGQWTLTILVMSLTYASCYGIGQFFFVVALKRGLMTYRRFEHGWGNSTPPVGLLKPLRLRLS